MRGKDWQCFAGSSACGITPAYAGKRLADILEKRDQTGSPPPMRGKAANEIVVSAYLGITPAYAGKSPERVPVRLQSRDHPRLCGEKYNVIHFLSPPSGSPPPMRGKVLYV